MPFAHVPFAGQQIYATSDAGDPNTIDWPDNRHKNRSIPVRMCCNASGCPQSVHLRKSHTATKRQNDYPRFHSPHKTAAQLTHLKTVVFAVHPFHQQIFLLVSLHATQQTQHLRHIILFRSGIIAVLINDHHLGGVRIRTNAVGRAAMSVPIRIQCHTATGKIVVVGDRNGHIVGREERGWP